MDKQKWKELLEQLRNTEGVTLTAFPETDKDGYFVELRYVLFEYNGIFYYIDKSNFALTICAFRKVNPYEKQQITLPQTIRDFKDILAYINEDRKTVPVGGTYKQRIYLTELHGTRNGKTYLWMLRNELAKNREKEILKHLGRIEMVRNSEGYKVLRFHDINKEDWFDYECNSKRITG